MKLEEYYEDALPTLIRGKQYLTDMLEEYPVRKTVDGIQPVLYTRSRIKTPESLILKLQKKGYPTDYHTGLEKVHDIIGARVICSFVEEVYQVTKWIESRKDVQIIERKDYIAYPKPNGYRSLHLILQFKEKGLEHISAEIQLRTIAHDFWAVLEHQMKYKKSVDHETVIKSELKRCADEIASLDMSMQTIRDLLREWDKEE